MRHHWDPQMMAEDVDRPRPRRGMHAFTADPSAIRRWRRAVFFWRLRLIVWRILMATPWVAAVVFWALLIGWLVFVKGSISAG